MGGGGGGAEAAEASAEAAVPVGTRAALSSLRKAVTVAIVCLGFVSTVTCHRGEAACAPNTFNPLFTRALKQEEAHNLLIIAGKKWQQWQCGRKRGFNRIGNTGK